jgi:hypothetical protein
MTVLLRTHCALCSTLFVKAIKKREPCSLARVKFQHVLNLHKRCHGSSRLFVQSVDQNTNEQPTGVQRRTGSATDSINPFHAEFHFTEISSRIFSGRPKWQEVKVVSVLN